ncbi:hypothetical protein Hdeb2414_s0003g00105471 [Helianthus debilis subsp. tardiflorus]
MFAAGAMIEAILSDGKPVWLDQIRDRSLHPTSESFALYANTILGEDGEDDLDDATDPVREEVILETRKKKKLDNPEKKEKKVEEKVTGAPREGEKRTERDPDDDETLTEIMKKKKVLEDKKKELDEQAAAALATKRSKLQKETPPAPSESEIDMGVFSAKRGNLLEKIYVASGSQGVKPGKAPRKIDISKITPPTSPPSRTFDLSPPPRDDLGEKKKTDDVEVEQFGEGGAAAGGDVGGDGRGEGVDTEAESSEATPCHTIYTKRPPGSGGSGTSGVPRSPEYENVQVGS